MRRLFSRAAAPTRESTVAQASEISLNCAHGCPACPHSATWAGFDDDAASTLLPQSGAAIDGQSLRFEAAGSGAFDAEPDGDAGSADDDFEVPD
jgi:hypothetical protein